VELTRLIDALRNPAAYPEAVGPVEVRQTHLSVVFLAGPFAYKIKKPVDLGFVDFTSLEKRRHFCQEEVRLNRRLAPAVYRGVVPVASTPHGVAVGGAGDVIEWAVQMERLPEEAALRQRLRRGEVGPELMDNLARKLAGFHAHAASGPAVAAFGRFDVVAQNARENFEQSAPQVGVTLSRAVFDRLGPLTEEALTRLRPLIEARALRGVPRDTHGDLHLDHVYLFPERSPPADLVIIDCIEFNERFRFADPVADMAFLVMDLLFHGRKDLAAVFSRAYFRAADDPEGAALLDFYIAYRAAVRGKVEGFKAAEEEVPDAERSAALTRARAHWLLALGALEAPDRKPCLVLIGGLPGAGKSTLARGLAGRANCVLLRSDVVRKELAGLSARDPAAAPYGEGIYTPAWTDRTYAECLRRAEGSLGEGKRVVVDATFAAEAKRAAFLEAAARLAVPAVFLLCQASPETVRQRLARRRGDVSDAGPAVYEQAARRWQPVSPHTRPALREIPTDGTEAQALARALAVLRAEGLLGEAGRDAEGSDILPNRSTS
jgi:aminoglycoside phosphotransferase family enzyme/predicted kinase